MKHKLFIAIAALFAWSISASGELSRSTCGESLTCALEGTSPSYTLRISGTGAMTDFSNDTDRPWHVDASNITTVVIEAGVTSIGNIAFKNFTVLNNVTIGSDVTSIGEQVFWGCSALTSISIPASVLSIGNSAFDACSALATVTINRYVYGDANPITTIGTDAFDRVSLKAQIKVPSCEALVAYMGNAQWAAYNPYFPLSVSGGACPDQVWAYEDPVNKGDYYTTFFDGDTKYSLPASTEAFKATLNGETSLLLTKIADTGQTIPANKAVILRITGTPNQNILQIPLVESDAEAVTIGEDNALQGTDGGISDAQYNIEGTVYVLSGGYDDDPDAGVGFYKLADDIAVPAHKAYVVLSSGGSSAPPRRLAFVYNSLLGATGVEEVESNQSSAVSVQKVLIDGQLYLMYDGKMYDVRGQLVK